MSRAGAALGAVLVALVAVLGPPARPAGASHGDPELWVTVAINAAGDDRLSFTTAHADLTIPVDLGNEVATALGLTPGSFRQDEGANRYSFALPERVARPDDRGRLSYAADTGKLQVVAQRKGYETVFFEVCTPRVRQVIDTLVAPGSTPTFSPSRCRAWFQPVEEPPLRAVVQLAPDRERYPSAVTRAVGVAAITFALVGLGATLLRRGPLRRRSFGSWLLAVGSALGVGALGWFVATFALWWSGAAADPMMLDEGGSVGEQVARTMLPGLAFLLPGLLPAAVLLSVPRREEHPPPPSPAPAAGPPPITWWPGAWWPQWAAQTGGAHRPAAPPPPQPPPAAPNPRPPGPPAPGPPAPPPPAPPPATARAPVPPGPPPPGQTPPGQTPPGSPPPPGLLPPPGPPPAGVAPSPPGPGPGADPSGWVPPGSTDG